MLSATRMATLVVVLAVGGSLALVVGPLAPDAEVPAGSVADAPGLEDAAWFSGHGSVRVDDWGTDWMSDGIGHVQGHVSTMLAELIVVDDSRAGGNATFTQNIRDYGGFGPVWGTMRIEDEDGVWVGEMTGILYSGGSEFSGWLVGKDAYEGLVQYRQYVVGEGPTGIEFSGAIFPADVLPLEPKVLPAE